jgi:DNA-binding response OmpR family regulator
MIMVITYRPELRDRVVERLRRCGYEVAVPPHRQDVLDAVSQIKPDLIILDMYVADPSGLEMLRRIRGAEYRGKVVALGGASLSTVLSTAQALGVDQVVSGLELNNSTFDLGPLEATVRAALPPSPEVGV